MIGVLIHWRIKPDAKSVADFKEHWRTMNKVEDRSSLAIEILTEVIPAEHFAPTTWNINADEPGEHVSFVTVGFWANHFEFSAAVGGFFNDEKGLLPFEALRRRRVTLSPKDHRVGDVELPVRDSRGVD
jgi:hypothetical protein